MSIGRISRHLSETEAVGNASTGVGITSGGGRSAPKAAVSRHQAKVARAHVAKHKHAKKPHHHKPRVHHRRRVTHHHRRHHGWW